MYFPIQQILFIDGDDGADNTFFNIDFNDGDRSWLTDILQEDTLESRNHVASQYNSLMQIHKRKKILGLNDEVSSL